MKFERVHVCDATPNGSNCTAVGEFSFVNVYMGDVAFSPDGLCRSLDTAVKIEAEFCPWCGERIREVAE